METWVPVARGADFLVILHCLVVVEPKLLLLLMNSLVAVAEMVEEMVVVEMLRPILNYI
jgi:hypothetical protein